MSSRIVYDDDSLEEYFKNLSESDEPLKLFDKRIFLQAVAVMLQIELMAVFAVTAVSGGMFSFDFEMFWEIQIVQVMPVLKAAWNATMNFKLRKYKKDLISANATFIKQKNVQVQEQQVEITRLEKLNKEQRVELDRQAQLYTALSAANTQAEYELVKKLISSGALAVNVPVDENVNNEVDS